MQKQIFNAISLYGSKIEIRVIGNVALIATNDASNCIIITNLIDCISHQTTLITC